MNYRALRKGLSWLSACYVKHENLNWIPTKKEGACKWVEVDKTALSEVALTQKDEHGMHPLMSEYYL